MSKEQIKGLRLSLQYVIDRLSTGMKYSDDMHTSLELCAKDAQYILNKALELHEENKQQKDIADSINEKLGVKK